MKFKFNPLYLWIAVAWCASKVLQLLTRSPETIWETGWNRFLDAFGNFFIQLTRDFIHFASFFNYVPCSKAKMDTKSLFMAPLD